MIDMNKPHIIWLQEVVQDTSKLKALFRAKGYNAQSSLGVNNKPGVAILYMSTWR